VFKETVASAFSTFENLEENERNSLAQCLESIYAGKTRSSGEPYLEYISGILKYLSDLNLDYHTLVAGALWNVYALEKTPDPIFKRFDREITDLAKRTYDIQRIEYRASVDGQIEKFRNMILAMAKDIRVVFILLADRTHVLKVIDCYPTHQPIKDAKSVRDVYAPLANRLGIGKLKLLLEDLSFKILEPEIFGTLEMQIQARRSDRDAYLESVKDLVSSKISEEKINATITGRVKHRFSIYKKMIKQHISFDEVYDVVGIRVITDSVKSCYSVLGIIHSLWKPIPHRFKDYVAMPKNNMYQSIHTSVVGPSAFPLEVQIRTYEMNRIAEIGIAAHWRYKDEISQKYERKFLWLRQIMQWIQEKSDPDELMEMLRVDFFPDEVYVFTPLGDVKTLPKGSTVIDFAFQVHSDVGYHCKGGRVRSKLVPLRTKLQTGDVVEIITSPQAHPHADWLQYVKTPSARSKIRKYLREQNKTHALQIGKDVFFKALRNRKLRSREIIKSPEFEDIRTKLGFKTSDDLMAAIGFGEISVQQIINRLKIQLVKAEQLDQRQLGKSRMDQNRVTVDQMPNVMLKFARCCEPLPGEEIIGYVTHGRGITIHAARCSNIRKMERERIIRADWEPDDRPAYPVRIGFRSHHHPLLLQDIMKIFNDHNVIILSQKTETSRRKDKVRGEYVIEVQDMDNLMSVMSNLEKVPGMIGVERLLYR
jgi:GTP diphosphokinase / guanosine-3',5'-bis(diphosphate) 3'-diphosphatase